MRILLAGLLCAFCALAAAQTTISGTVKDQTSGETVPGAFVEAKGTLAKTVSRMNGGYVLNIPAEVETVVIVTKAMGYQTDSTALQISSNSLQHDIFLSQKATNLKNVVIDGRFEGQQKALMDQKHDQTIKNIVNKEQIELFPDVNAAEAIQRLPGVTLQRDQGEGRFVQLRGTPPELTNFNINGAQIPSPEGDVRYVGLDVISVDQIETIEITKALTPDMNGDAIGGNVNIITRRAEDTIPEIRVAGTTGLNNIINGINLQGQFSYGLRHKKFGFHLNGNYYQNHQGAHNMEFKYIKRNTQDNSEFRPIYKDIQLRHYDINRERVGMSSTLDYKFNEKSNIFLQGMFNRFSDDETRRRTRYKFGSGTIINETRALEASLERDLKDRIKTQWVSTLNLGGKHEWSFINIDYNIGYAVAVERVDPSLEITFDSEELNMELDLTDYNFPVIVWPSDKDLDIAEDYSSYEFDEMEISDGLTTDKNLTTILNFEVPYGQTDHVRFVKFGGQLRAKNKERDNNGVVYNRYFTTFLPPPFQAVYTLEGPEIDLTTFMGSYNETNMLNRGYELGPHPDAQRTYEFLEFYQTNFKINELELKRKTYEEDYTAKEDVYAAYIMVEHNFHRLMLLGGFRYELTLIEHQGNELIIYDARAFKELNPIESTKSYQFLLPQFHLKYELTPSTNLRAAYTHSYSRPNFEDILPYRQQDNLEVTFGNTNLKFPKAVNIDLLAETYFKNNGVIQGGFFYKRIDEFIFNYKRFVHLDSSLKNAPLVEVSMANNGLQAFVYGFELTSNFKLNFLPNQWANFGLYGNYTYTYSEAFISQRVKVQDLDQVFIFATDGSSEFVLNNGQTDKIPLPGQAPHTLNLALFYDTDKFYAKISSNFQSSFLTELGQEEDFDEYYGSNFRLDFSADYQITDKVKIFMQAINLTNAPLMIYMGIPERVKQQEYYSWSLRFGCRATF